MWEEHPCFVLWLDFLGETSISLHPLQPLLKGFTLALGLSNWLQSLQNDMPTQGKKLHASPSLQSDTHIYFQISSIVVKSMGFEDNSYSILDSVIRIGPSIKVTFEQRPK